MSEILTPNEHVQLTVRRHWIPVLGSVLPGIIIAILLLVFRSLLSNTSVLTPSGEVTLPALSPEILNGMTAIFLLIIALHLFHIFADYYLDIWIVTNRRIISILQKGFFSREVNSFRLERFQNIQTDIHGFIPTLFN